MWSLVDSTKGRERWEARFPPENLAASMDPFVDRKASIVVTDGTALLSIPGSEPTRHENLIEAWVVGERIAHGREAEIERSAFEMSGLSRDRWEFSHSAFFDRTDRTLSIRLERDASGWAPYFGTERLGAFENAATAVQTLDDLPYLPTSDLERLEKIYAGTYGKSHPDHTQDLVAAGLVTVDDDWNRSLTGEGRRAIDNDPRSMPLGLREIVFERIASEFARIGSDAKKVITNEIDPHRPESDLHDDEEVDTELSLDTLDEVRFAFSHYLTAIGPGCDTRLLMTALRDDLELNVDVADTEPHEVIVTATGETGEGTLWRGMTVVLLSPEWVEDRSPLLAKAIVDSRDALVAEMGRLPSQCPSSRSFRIP